MPNINEWTFTADIASQINIILRDQPELPFSTARVEERGRGTRKRRDLTIYDREGQIVLTGEIKMPDNPEGRSPYQESLVIDAHEKANTIGVPYYFTWNVNKCVLWKTFEQGKSITERYLEPFDALSAPIRTSGELLHPRVQDQINRFLVRFLERCAAIFSGAEPMPLLPLDVKFIDVWEAGLLPLVADTLYAINQAYETDRTFKNQLNRWMRDEQGWTLSSDEDILRDNLERAAKFTCYVLANKIVFYKALRRRFTRMRVLRIPSSIITGEDLRSHLNDYFEHAMQVSNDYQTVFSGDFGDTLPFMSDAAVNDWRSLSTQTDAFDFTQINYEVMGQIFERLLSTTERHKFGQHYTRSEVVDLINAFCIRDPNVTVLDPACGGGTFPVRAYQRKSDLSDKTLTHQELIGSLYGLDISTYPVHLTTINLATRDLVEEANYPLVARQDFMRLRPGEPIFHVPLGTAGRAGQETLLQLPEVDVVVGNPPYVRQEKINDYYGRGYKNLLQETARRDAPDIILSGRSDILCYFFTHGGAFLKENGYMGLLTSSTWLDTAYGFRLQKYLLDNYEIIAILESNCEPWFTGARVTTAATILHKQADGAKRRANLVKFVWLKRPLSEFLTYARTEDDRRLTFEDLRDRIMRLRSEEETDAWRVRVLRQDELYRAGCLPISITEEEEAQGEEEDDVDDSQDSDSERDMVKRPLPGLKREDEEEIRSGDYIGYKWGIFLRAPAIFFKLLERGGDQFVPLGQIAEIKRGITSGCDTFFFPVDITSKAIASALSEREFKETYGIRRADTQDIRIVLAGDRTRHLIETQYLEPEIHSVMGLDSIEIKIDQLKRRAFFVSESKEKLKGTEVLKYIKWGEREGFHEGSTVRGRVSTGRQWYDITTDRRSDVIWCKAHQYRHIAWLNDHKLPVNCRMYDIFVPHSVNSTILCACLNSTVVALTKAFFGRYVGREANLDTEVLDAKMMLVPDPRAVSKRIASRLEAAFNSMRQRTALQMVDVDSTTVELTGELALQDRQELDDAVLELLGINNAKERVTLRQELYEEITTLYRQLRVAERIMQRYRSQTARRGRATAHSIAEEIWEDLETPFVYKTPLDFIPTVARSEQIELPIGRGQIVKPHMFEPGGIKINGSFIELDDPRRSAFVKELNRLGIAGLVKVPIAGQSCVEAMDSYNEYFENVNEKLITLAAAYTADEGMQERVVRELWKKMRVIDAGPVR